MWAHTTKIWVGKNFYNFVQFWTTLDFNHIYLRNGSRYRQAEIGIINYNRYLPYLYHHHHHHDSWGPLRRLSMMTVILCLLPLPSDTQWWSIANLHDPGVTLPYLNFGLGWLLHLPSAEAVSVRPNAQPWCNHKVTVIGCEAEIGCKAKQITSHLGLVTCSMVVPIRWSALG